MTKSTDNVPLVSLTTHDHVALYYVDLGSRLDLSLLDEDSYVHSQFQDPAEDGAQQVDLWQRISPARQIGS